MKTVVATVAAVFACMMLVVGTAHQTRAVDIDDYDNETLARMNGQQPFVIAQEDAEDGDIDEGDEPEAVMGRAVSASLILAQAGEEAEDVDEPETAARQEGTASLVVSQDDADDGGSDDAGDDGEAMQRRAARRHV
jgi:hypothetical protein